MDNSLYSSLKHDCQDNAEDITNIISLTSPILFLIFNRPETTRHVFSAIRQAKPPRLYIAADGPRKGRKNEKKLCQEVKKITAEVDWPCKVKTLFRDKNLGCRHAVSSAIDWFFEHEEQGIILEDDCLPSQSFFGYCQELLEYYKHDSRIMVISGNNFQQKRTVNQDSYYFSRYNHCWGWATWRRAWKYYDNNMQLWPTFKKNNGLEAWADGNKLFIRYWTKIFNDVSANKIDSWAYIWTFSCWTQGGLTCLPKVNLVKNIGFGEHATHTTQKNKTFDNQYLSDIDLPLQHPSIIVRNISADRFTDKNHFFISPIKLLLNQYKDLLCHHFRIL